MCHEWNSMRPNVPHATSSTSHWLCGDSENLPRQEVREWRPLSGGMRSGSWRAAAGILPHPWQLAKEVGADISWILTVFFCWCTLWVRNTATDDVPENVLRRSSAAHTQVKCNGPKTIAETMGQSSFCWHFIGHRYKTTPRNCPSDAPFPDMDETTWRFPGSGRAEVRCLVITWPVNIGSCDYNAMQFIVNR